MATTSKALGASPLPTRKTIATPADRSWRGLRHWKSQMVQLPAAIGKVTLSAWLLELWQLVPHPGLIDDRRLDAGHSGLIGKAVECKVLQMLHITGHDMNYKIPASGN